MSDHRVPTKGLNLEISQPRDHRRLLTYGLSGEEHELLRGHESVGHELVRVSDHGALIRQMVSGERVIVVLDSATVSDSALGGIVETAASRNLPLVYVITLTPRVARHVLACSRAGVSPTIVIRGFDYLDRSIGKLIANGRAPDAISAVASGFPNGWDEGTKALAAEAAVVGRGACSVAAWAGARGESVRSLDRRVADCLLPTAKRLLTWMLFMHTAWRIEAMGWPPKKAAAEAGVDSPRELARRFRRVIPEQVDAPLRRLCFPEAYESFVTTVGRAGS